MARTQSEYLQLVSRWEQSGKSIPDFCREERLSLPTFYKYRRALKEDVPAQKTINNFVEVIPVDDKSDHFLVLKITTSRGCVVEIPL